MSALLRAALDGERRAEAQAADDRAVCREREAQRHTPPYWMFAARTEPQRRIRHPLAPSEERPRHPRFGAPAR